MGLWEAMPGWLGGGDWCCGDKDLAVARTGCCVGEWIKRGLEGVLEELL